MSTHNICFRREIRKILSGYPLLSVAMAEPQFLLSLFFSIVHVFRLLHVISNGQAYY